MTVIPFLPWPKSPLVDNDDSDHLTGTLIIVDDYFDNLLEQLCENPRLTTRQIEIIDTLNTKIMAFQLKASSLLMHDRNPQQNAGE